MPTEWIHHPWDAPAHVLKASGVELGSNYPNPIIDLDMARANLMEAIFKMWESEATAQATDQNGTGEVVGDNSDAYEYKNTTPTPKVISSGTANPGTTPTLSSNDQKVPSMQNSKSGMVPRKRPQDEAPNNQPGESRVEDDACSTAESSSASKKQATTSRNSFSVPHSYCSGSLPIGRPLEELELESYELTPEPGPSKVCSENNLS